MLYSMGIGIRIPYDSKLAVNVHRACSCHLSPPHPTTSHPWLLLCMVILVEQHQQGGSNILLFSISHLHHIAISVLNSYCTLISMTLSFCLVITTSHCYYLVISMLHSYWCWSVGINLTGDQYAPNRSVFCLAVSLPHCYIWVVCMPHSYCSVIWPSMPQ